MSRYKCWMYNSMYIVEIKLAYIYIFIDTSKIINIIWMPKICIYRINHNYIYVQDYDGGIYWGCQWIIHHHLTAICLRKFMTTGSGVDKHGQSHVRPCKT